MTAPGAHAMRLAADGRTVWILREVCAARLHTGELGKTIGMAHTTLVKKVATLNGAGVIGREDGGRRSEGFALFPAAPGPDLLALVDGVLAWWLAIEPAGLSLIFGPSGALVLHAMADPATPRILVALGESPRRLSTLERLLPGLTRSQIQKRLEVLELVKLARREGERYALLPAGREAIVHVARGARLEQLHSLPGASAPAPPDIGVVLCLALPLVEAPRGLAGAVELVVEPDEGEGEPERLLALAEPGQPLVVPDPRRALVGTADPGPPIARAAGPVQAWCAALLDRRDDALRFVGDARAAATIASLGARFDAVANPAAA